MPGAWLEIYGYGTMILMLYDAFIIPCGLMVATSFTFVTADLHILTFNVDIP